MGKGKKALWRGGEGASAVCCIRRMSKWHRSSKIKPVVMRHRGCQVWSGHPTAPVVHHVVDFLRNVPTVAARLS